MTTQTIRQKIEQFIEDTTNEAKPVNDGLSVVFYDENKTIPPRLRQAHNLPDQRGRPRKQKERRNRTFVFSDSKQVKKIVLPISQ